MADITMCFGNDCRVKKTCYRFTAKPNTHWQSCFTPIKTGKNCIDKIEKICYNSSDKNGGTNGRKNRKRKA